MHASLRARIAALPALVLAAGLLAGCGTDETPVAAATATTPSALRAADGAADDASVIPVSVDGCGTNWTPGPAGEQTLTLHNSDFRGGEARVVSVKDGHPREVFADVEPFGPGTTSTVHVRLGAGRYAIACLMQDQQPLMGPVVTITGTGTGGPGIRPADDNQLILAAWQYQRWVLGRLPGLVADTRRLSDALGRHDLTSARSAWIAAHVDYETLGAAYDAFGDLDGAIDGGPAGLPGGTSDPDFTGFHRIETTLFGRTPSPAAYADLVRRTEALLRDVRALHDQLASAQMDPLTVTVRAHEITENLLQTQLTGTDDLGSHTDLASIGAGLDGTTQVLGFLHPQLAPRFAGTKALDALVARDRAVVSRDLHRPWARRPVADWPPADRERISAMVADLAERLAPVASILEPRRDD